MKQVFMKHLWTIIHHSVQYSTWEENTMINSAGTSSCSTRQWLKLWVLTYQKIEFLRVESKPFMFQGTNKKLIFRAGRSLQQQTWFYALNPHPNDSMQPTKVIHIQGWQKANSWNPGAPRSSSKHQMNFIPWILWNQISTPDQPRNP